MLAGCGWPVGHARAWPLARYPLWLPGVRPLPVAAAFRQSAANRLLRAVGRQPLVAPHRSAATAAAYAGTAQRGLRCSRPAARDALVFVRNRYGSGVPWRGVREVRKMLAGGSDRRRCPAGMMEWGRADVVGSLDLVTPYGDAGQPAVIGPFVDLAHAAPATGEGMGVRVLPLHEREGGTGSYGFLEGRSEKNANR